MWRLWFQWVLATAAGFGLGGVLGHFLTWPIDDLQRYSGFPTSGTLGWIPNAIASYTPVGLFVGILQRRVLRRVNSLSRRWLLCSLAGYALGSVIGVVTFFALVDYMGYGGSMAVAFAAGGFTVGVLQWVVLRRSARGAGWWVLVSGLTFPLLWLLSIYSPRPFLWPFLWPIASVKVYIGWFEVYVRSAIDAGIGAALAGAVVGISTGAILLRLLPRITTPPVTR